MAKKLSNKELEAKLRRKHPDLAPYLKVPQLRAILLKGVQNNWKADRFASAIQGSKWYRNHNQAERTWITLTPADKKQLVQQQKESLTEWYNDLLDTNLPPSHFKKWAKDIASGKMSVATYQRKVRNSREYRQRFPGNMALRRRGMPELDETEYKRREEDYRNVLASYGLPSEYYDDPSDFRALFNQRTTPEAFEQRMSVYHALTTQYGGRVRQAFARHLGVDLSEADAYRVITGQRADLSRAYAEQTGTDFFNTRDISTRALLEQRNRVSTVAVTDAMRSALGEEEALFTSGGGQATVATGAERETF